MLSVSLIEVVWKSSNCLLYVLNELAKALPFSITIDLEAISSGLDETSCKELKNRPINLPRSLSLGSNIFSSWFNFSTIFWYLTYSALLSLRFDERNASKDLLILLTLTPRPDWSGIFVTPPWELGTSSKSAALLL